MYTKCDKFSILFAEIIKIIGLILTDLKLFSEKYVFLWKKVYPLLDFGASNAPGNVSASRGLPLHRSVQSL